MCTHVAAALLACPYCQRYDPAVVVYYCGTNDAIHPPGRPAQEIADGFYAFVDAVHALAGKRGGAGRRPPHIIYLCPVASQFHQVRTGVAHAHTRAVDRARPCPRMQLGTCLPVLNRVLPPCWLCLLPQALAISGRVLAVCASPVLTAC